MLAFVDPDVCIGCGLCVNTCPEVFEMNGERSEAAPGPVPNDNIESCQEATESCPVEAIRIEED